MLRKGFLLALALVAVVLGMGRLSAGYLMERWALTTGPNGPETPADLGVPFQRVVIPSGSRGLDGYLVRARPSCKDAPVLLIYHGMQETISEWVKAQEFLYDHCVASLIFDPTGSGDSPRPVHMDEIGEDAVAVYEFTVRRFAGQRVYVFGHSLGNGPMLEAVPRFSSPPAGVIVTGAFRSLRGQGVIQRHLLYRVLAATLPDWWNNVAAVQRVRAPLLVVHSDADRVNPVSGGEAIFAVASQPKTFVMLHGFKHNALYQAPVEAWWEPVLSFVKARR